jgi:hypothetical protein
MQKKQDSMLSTSFGWCNLEEHLHAGQRIIGVVGIGG